MSAKSIVHQLLFDSLLEMRQRGHESGDQVVYHLADLFHNAVLQMERAGSADDEGDFDAVLQYLRRRAKEKGCEQWIESHLDELTAKAAG